MTSATETLQRAFTKHYGSAPTHLVRAPGRVNLIGEHIDYNGLSVLPMAIERHVAVLFHANADGVVRLTTVDDRFAPREFAVERSIPSYPTGDWGNYLKAAAQALAAGHGARVGIDAVVGSSLPAAAGLSSSSALVIAIALALAHANDLAIPPLALAGTLADGERYVGTQGGGMDQAICLLARRGTASRIDFGPLHATPVPIPSDWRFVVAHSLARAEKSGRVQAEYNRRTEECRAALQRVAAHVGLGGTRPTYRALIDAHGTDGLVDAAGSCLDGAYRARFCHVVTEADRVHASESALRAADLPTFGRLLLASHESLRDDYAVSTPALDEIVTLACDAGAAGARLTGAGMGGCAIAVCRAERLHRVTEALRDHFYAGRPVDDRLDDLLFAAEPAGGATIGAV